MLAGDLGRRTGRSESYPRSSLGVPRQVLTHGAVKLTFRGGQFFGVGPLSDFMLYSSCSSNSLYSVTSPFKLYTIGLDTR